MALLACSPRGEVVFQSNAAELSLTASTAGPVAYRVRSTCPQRYAVEPSTGTLEPGGSAVVRITGSPPSSTDRFMVLACPARVAHHEWETRRDVQFAKFRVVVRKYVNGVYSDLQHSPGQLNGAAVSRCVSDVSTAYPAVLDPTPSEGSGDELRDYVRLLQPGLDTSTPGWTGLAAWAEKCAKHFRAAGDTWITERDAARVLCKE